MEDQTSAGSSIPMFSNSDAITSLQKLMDLPNNKRMYDRNCRSAKGGDKFGIKPVGNKIPEKFKRTQFNSPYTELAHHEVLDTDIINIKIDDALTLRNVAFEKTVIVIPFLQVAKMTTVHIFTHLAIFLFPFIKAADESVGADNITVYQAYLMIMKFYGSPLSEEELTEALDDKNLCIKYLPCETLEDFVTECGRMYCQEDTEPFETYRRSLNEETTVDDDHLYCLVHLVLLALGKSCNPDYYDKYKKNRMAAIRSRISGRTSECSLTINAAGATLAYNSMSAAFKFRRLTFKFVLCFAQKGSDGKFKSACSLAIKMLEYAEMTHVGVINHFLLKMYPEFLSLRTLNDGDQALCKMIEFMSKLGPAAPFAKFLYTEYECLPVHRGKLDNYTIVASILASHTDSNYANYVTKSCEFSNIVRKIVTAYFRERAKVFSAAVAYNEHAAASDIESAMYLLANIQDNIDKDIDDIITRN